VNSKICLGKTTHTRTTPVVHSFVYPLLFAKFDLDELDKLNSETRFFGYNRFNLISIYDDDYLPGEEGSIKQRALSFLKKQGVDEDISRIELVTVPRVLTKVFNPVSFYRCYDTGGKMLCAMAEVNNTFKETHVYVLDESKKESDMGVDYIRYIDRKEFHVSPFNQIKGQYRFYFKENTDEIDIRVNIVRDDKTVFTSGIFGSPLSFSTPNLLRVFPRFIFYAQTAIPKITWEAAKLYFGKKLRVYTKPIASSSMTIRTQGPSFIQRACVKLGLKFLSRFKHGYLTLIFPDGESHSFGDSDSSMRATIWVHNYDFFVQGLLKADIGFGETFVDGYWDTDDLTELLKIFVDNTEIADPRSFLTTYLPRFWGYLKHYLRRNSAARSKKNISAHYDLSNEMFAQFLDPSMTYSCAFFQDETDTLETAQLNKIHRIIEKARISESDHVLELGCGWGGFAIEAAKKTGCRVTGVTLSEAQWAHAQKRIKEEGLQDRVKVAICDYRNLDETFDKIVSIEMLEAVGHQYLGNFFEVCERVLAPDGIAVFQVITMPDQRYGQYRRNCDWLQHYIFPGGHCPSLGALTSAIARKSEFLVEDVENIGDHYARTLKEWRERYHQNSERLRDLGFDERFDRIWHYYLCYCEAGFATRTLQTLQMVVTRPNNKQVPACVGY
jgi:cyclopropane-fatty-acyl-phospholipid synthase